MKKLIKNFNNSSKETLRGRMIKKVSYGINPLLDDEKQRLCAEYVTLHKNAMTVLKDLKGDSETKFKLEKVRYVLLTEERYYRS